MLSKILTSDTIKKINASTGASKIIHVTSSYGQTKVWVPWTDYPTVQLPDKQNSANVNYKVY